MRLRLTLVFALLAALCAAGSAFPVVGGTADNTAHPYVGAAIQLQTHGSATGYQLCSGFLISPTRFVTAAHCFPNNDEPIQVTFVRVDRPAEHVLVAVDFVVGTVEKYSGYRPSGGKNGTPLNDVAVITLSTPHPLSAYASPPTVPGADDALSPNQAIDVVGFGWSDVSHKTFTALGTRQFATTRLVSAGVLGDNYLALLTDPGACQADSGGPDLIADTDQVVALTTFGNGNPNCNGVQYSQRLDTQPILDFIWNG